MTNARRTRAVAVATQVSVKISKRRISNELASVGHSNASSANQENGKEKYVWWRIVHSSLPWKIYPERIKTSRVGRLFVTRVRGKDTQQKTRILMFVISVKTSVEVMVYSKANKFSRQRNEERKSVRVASIKALSWN